MAGSVNVVYELINSSDTAPAGNLEHSYLTIASFPGLMFGIINIVGQSHITTALTENSSAIADMAAERCTARSMKRWKGGSG